MAAAKNAQEKSMILKTKFKKWYLKNPRIDLYWSWVLNEHFISNKDGVALESGLWINKEKLLNECVPMAQRGEKFLKFYLAGLNVIGKEFKLCN